MSKCINCKYWNTIGGCIVCSKKEIDIKQKNFRRRALGLEEIKYEIPERPEGYISSIDKYFRKGDYCKWYEADFNIINNIFKRIFT